MLTLELKRTFLGLASRLSPENLTCDGELTRAQVAKRLKAIKAEWKATEDLAGRSVSEYEPYDWIKEIEADDNAKRLAKIAQQPSHPLLESSNPGVWSRKGKNQMTSYYIQNPSYRETMVVGGIKFGSDENIFNLYSEFGRLIGDREKLGEFTTLEDAVSYAESYLKTVTAEAIRAKRPLYRDENIQRELDRLP